MTKGMEEPGTINQKLANHKTAFLIPCYPPPQKDVGKHGMIQVVGLAPRSRLLFQLQEFKVIFSYLGD